MPANQEPPWRKTIQFRSDGNLILRFSHERKERERGKRIQRQKQNPSRFKPHVAQQPQSLILAFASYSNTFHLIFVILNPYQFFFWSILIIDPRCQLFRHYTPTSPDLSKNYLIYQIRRMEEPIVNASSNTLAFC